MSKHIVNLRVICHNPPKPASGDKAFEFGLQDKKQALIEGKSIADNHLQYNFELTVQQTDGGKPNFTGQFAHGTVKERFVYLTLKGFQNNEWRIVQRAKVQLKTVTWQQVAEVLANPDAYLQAEVDARGTGTVALLGEGWTVRTK